MNVSAVIGFFSYLIIMVLIGVWASRKNEEVKAVSGADWLSQYIVADRNLSWLAIGMAMVTTIYSAGTFIGAPGLAYSQGYVWPFTIGFQNLAGVLPLAIVGIRYNILGRKLNFVSYLDFYKARYNNKAILWVAGISLILLLVPLMTAQFAAGARVIEVFTGVPYKIAIAIMVVIVGFYTIVGGYRAVVITDILQGFVMIVGAVLLWTALVGTHGISDIHATILQSKPQNLLMKDIPLAIRGIWVFAIWVIGAPQTVWKCTTYKTSKDMYTAMILSAILVTVFSTTFQLWGVFGSALLPKLDAADKVIPTLILQYLPGYLAGILIVSPVAALMSTVDSALLISSATVVKDLYGMTGGRKLSLKETKYFTYGVSTLMVLFVLWTAISPPKFLEVFVQYSLGGIGAVFWWPFLLGLYWKGATDYGALSSMIISLPFYVLNDRYFHLFGLHSAITTWVLSGLVMVVVSLVTPKSPASTIRRCWEAYTTKTVAAQE
ncbi:MAG: sodium/pantothenate symporter [Ignavibacteriales bacterium]